MQNPFNNSRTLGFRAAAAILSVATLVKCAPDQANFMRATFQNAPEDQPKPFNVFVQTNPRLGQTLACIDGTGNDRSAPGTCTQLFAFEGSLKATVGLIIAAVSDAVGIAQAVALFKEADALAKQASNAASASNSGAGAQSGSSSNATGGASNVNVNVTQGGITVNSILSAVNKSNLTANQKQDLNAKLSQYQNQSQSQKQNQVGPKVTVPVTNNNNIDVQTPPPPMQKKGGYDSQPSSGWGSYDSSMRDSTSATQFAQASNARIVYGKDLQQIDAKRFVSFDFAGSGQVIVAENGKAPQIIDTRTAQKDRAIRVAYTMGATPLQTAMNTAVYALN